MSMWVFQITLMDVVKLAGPIGDVDEMMWDLLLLFFALLGRFLTEYILHRRISWSPQNSSFR